MCDLAREIFFGSPGIFGYFSCVFMITEKISKLDFTKFLDCKMTENWSEKFDQITPNPSQE